MKYVYAVGVLQLDESPNPRRWITAQRLWYLFSTFEAAEACVLENHGDIFEFYYTHALIEKIHMAGNRGKEVEDNGTPGPQTEWWYSADYSKGEEVKTLGGLVVGREPLIESCEKPKMLENTIHFWAG